MPLQIRPELPTDAAAITALATAAFRAAPHASGTEAAIVAALRRDGQLAVSLLAESDGATVGYVAASPVAVSGGATGWYGLGPVAVAPAWQHRGIGSRLVAGALDRLRADGAAGCVVLGEPAFYGRFGFASVPALALPGVPPAYFQALAFAGAVPAGSVTYARAFAAAAAAPA